MGIKDQILDAVGFETVHCSILSKDELIHKGAPFRTDVLIKSGKKGAVIDGIDSTLELTTLVPSGTRTARALVGLLALGAVGAITGADTSGDGSAGSIDKTIRIPIHHSKMKDRLILGADEEKILTITSLIPNKCPMDQGSKVSLDLNISINGAPNIKMEEQIRYLPNRLTHAVLNILDDDYGFIQDPISQQIKAPDLSEKYRLKPRIQPYEHVRNVTFTVTEIESGDLKYSFALELYDRPKRILKGDHATVRYSFQTIKRLYEDPDDEVIYPYIRSKLGEVFKEAEERFA